MTRYLPVLLVLCFTLSNAQDAEDELVLLKIDGDRIGPIENLDDRIDNAQQATGLINAYHLLLAAKARAKVESLHGEILTFLPGFEVAYKAADSAEIDHLMSEIDLRLAAIQDVHAQKYTQDVISLLNEAYQLILPTFGDEQ